MTAIAYEPWPEQADEPDVRIDGRVDPQLHDAYWRSVYWAQPYHRGDLDYEDYAPAYCVGYVGFAQYGSSFDDAEKSLCANWLRIKGDSRLPLEEAMLAIRAAWQHAEHSLAQAETEDEDDEQVIEVSERARRSAQPIYATA
jgi:hypothetical protein